MVSRIMRCAALRARVAHARAIITDGLMRRASRHPAGGDQMQEARCRSASATESTGRTTQHSTAWPECGQVIYNADMRVFAARRPDQANLQRGSYMRKAHPAAQFVRRVWLRQRRPVREHSHAFLPFFDDDHVFTETGLIYPKKALDITIPHGAVDVYFAPCLFRRKRRRQEYALPSRWLYADLDESKPQLLNSLPPTVAWETSRGRYQALWQLTSPLEGEEFLDLNQRVTYFTGADKGGWSSTKVLRIPGTISTKHGDDFQVRLMWWKDTAYDPELVSRIVAKARVPQTKVKGIPDLKLPKAPPDRILKRYAKKLPGRVRKLLAATEARGDRSERLWQLYGDMLGAGMKPEQVLVVIRPSVWNKYAGQRREINQLWSEITKAAAVLETKKKKARKKPDVDVDAEVRKKRLKKRRRLDFASSGSTDESSDGPEEERSEEKRKLDAGLESYDKFVNKKLKRPGWMVESIWAEGAHGVLAGEPKTYKSVISTDLAISVASGTKFLDEFEIPATGEVLMIQEENDPGEFQDRMLRIAASRGLGSAVSFSGDGDHITLKPNADLPIHLMNNRGFDLTSMEHLEWLDEQLGRRPIALVILDPFYLMTPGIDENSAAQVGPVLKNLLKLKQAHGCGMQLIHHYRKQNVMAPSQGAQRISGTGVFHRWFESAVYVEKTSDPSTVRLVPDHRGHRDQGAMRVTFDLGSHDDNDYYVNVYQQRADRAALHGRLNDLMKEQPEWKIGDLRRAMGMSSSKALKQMIEDHGLIVETRRSGGRGRPSKIVRTMTDQGRKSQVTQARNRGEL